MEQPTFADLEYDGKKRKTRRERFLECMDGLIPWDRLEDRIRPFYPKAGRGRRPYDLSVMLRIHCVQLFYNPGLRRGRFWSLFRMCDCAWWEGVGLAHAGCGWGPHQPK